MNLKGGCYCGEIRYEINGELQTSFQCHCRECQYITGGNPNVVVVFAQNDFRYILGSIQTFARDDLETPVLRHFCSKCGTGIGSQSPSRPNSMIVKVGTLDGQSFFEPNFAIFTCDKKHYHVIPEGLSSHDKRPVKK